MSVPPDESRDARHNNAPADIESPPHARRSVLKRAATIFVSRCDNSTRPSEIRNFYMYVVENVKQGDPAHFTKSLR